jgi:LDH2 family malate/lactate/ureidoglycolate dehydrogenase
MSIALPAGQQPPMILDMGGLGLGRSAQMVESNPMALFKALGLGSAVIMLSGLLADIWRPEIMAPKGKWESNQGSFLTAWSVSHFLDVDRFKAQMDDWIGTVRQMKPLPGFDRAELPGGMEWAWERDNAELGIPITDEHRKKLARWAVEAGLEPPFDQYEDTRF